MYTNVNYHSFFNVIFVILNSFFIIIIIHRYIKILRKLTELNTYLLL